MTDKKPETPSKEITQADAQALKRAMELIEGDESSAIVMPAVNAAAAIEAWKAYEALKKAIITPEDIQPIQGKQFLKKSYWRKVATFFNLSVDIVTEKKEELEHGNTTYHFVCKATAPNGRFAIGAGSCNIYEKSKWDEKSGVWLTAYGKTSEPNSIHNARATAETRAWNRAVSNLVGGGEVSAEEVQEIREEKHQASEPDPVEDWQPSPTETPRTRPVPQKAADGECPVDHSTLRVLTVKKEGRNKGRTFKSCQKCGHFEWVS